MATAESLVDLYDNAVSEKDDVDSLPSISTDEIYSDVDSEEDSDAQAEWERSLEQLQLILTMMIVPWMGKYFGRKFAYWSKYQRRLLGRRGHVVGRGGTLTKNDAGWSKYMHWMHNVEVQYTSKKTFKLFGAVEAAL